MPMSREPLFCSANVALLRAPVHPVGRARGLAAADEPADAAVRTLTELATDPLVPEAISISSPSLSHRLDTLIDRGSDRPASTPADLRRAVRALTSYRLRMASRSTPFGLMAGVAPVSMVDDPANAKVRLGTQHRRSARPDQEWLGEVIRDCERRPEVLARLRVVFNNLSFARGDRLVLPYVPSSAEGQRTRTAVQEVSLRHTAAVRLVAELAGVPILFRDLATRVAEAFHAVPADTVDAMLTQLVRKELILTELRPGMDVVDPLGHVIRVLTAVCPTVAGQLDALRGDLARYSGQPLGHGRPALTAVRERMREMSPEEPTVQVDLALDADVALPRAVAVEAEQLAELLWRLSPQEPGTAALRQYHNDFLERYGQGRLVGLTELLDPDVGMGAPAGYRMPPTFRFRRPEPAPERDRHRDRILAELVQEATLTGQPEVVLTDQHPLLATCASDEGRPPASLELHTHLLAESVLALQRGDFLLTVVGALGHAAASCGRFAHLFDGEARDAFGAVARAGVTVDPQACPVQLTYQVRTPRGGNVAHVPRWAPTTLPVAAFAETADPTVRRLADLAVGADSHGVFVIDTSDGQEVVPTTFHLLNAHNESPNVARFLREISSIGVRRWLPWDWGGASVLPYTPRVRYGRGVLTLARWRPAGRLRDQRVPFTDWLTELSSWRARWRVPDEVCLAYADHRIELDLNERAHLRLLRHELGRRDLAVLTEAPAAAGAGTGWLSSPDGAHRNELVFPLLAARSVRRPARPRGVQRRPATGRHLPGGEWLYALVYCSGERQDELLRAVPALAAGLDVDRWFFLRYGDPDPHLRLRFHGASTVLTTGVLPRLTEWMARLRDAGMARRMVLDTYDPELERYGGPQAIEAAERVFHVDSVAVAEQLRLLACGALDIDTTLLTAANHIDLAVRFCGGLEAAVDWITGEFGRSAEHSWFRRHRSAALKLINPYEGWGGLLDTPGGAAVLTAWEARADAVTRYGRLIRERDDGSWPPEGAVLRSLLHMHHNRLAGLDRDMELRSFAVARGAVATHRDRRRLGR
ncbi:lantibiotic dehydratase [Micromonospora rifamycinica]|uniref:lantibiotic dehydratase n=1 Tax=Micromonospora rifamycinica TaxID=291594 RepID=UPI0033D39BF4